MLWATRIFRRLLTPPPRRVAAALDLARFFIAEERPALAVKAAAFAVLEARVLYLGLARTGEALARIEPLVKEPPDRGGVSLDLAGLLLEVFPI